MLKLVRIISVFVILSFSLCGCGKYRYYSLEPDDSVSRAVYDAVGEDLNYHGKEEINGRVQYDYELEKLEVETIPEFVKAVNSALGDDQEKIEVVVDVAMLSGQHVYVCSLSNYSDDNLEKADYDGLRSLSINDRLDELDSVFPEPLTYYTGIEGIRRLKTGVRMQQRADEEGINWYECWPDLEEIIFKDDISRAVYDEIGSDYLYFLGDNGTKYRYLLKQTDTETISKFVKAINSALGDEQEKIMVDVSVEIPDDPDGLAEVFSLYNYSDADLEKADYDGLCELFIYAPDSAGDEQFFPDPVEYMGIAGIKRLHIDKQMQQRADEEGIDWYECWPELEEITVEEPETLVTQ